MACYHPLQAYQCADGSVVFAERQRFNVVRSLLLACGQCIGCRLERSRQWAIRCVNEASLYDKNCFITLTYDDAHLPVGMSLVYRDFQLFMKRLRKCFGGERIRFFMCGEYGESFGRPHFHACLFNFDFPDKVVKRRNSGIVLYRSPLLESLWRVGFSSIGSVTFESAAYVARYIVKKFVGKDSEDFYRFVDVESGECFPRTPEFCHMSLKPGIGAKWLEKYMSDVYPEGRIVSRGRLVRAPKFYDRRFARSCPDEWEYLAFTRESEMRSRYENNTVPRLAVREAVAEASVARFSRSLA